MFFITLVVITALCLALPITRGHGVVCTAMLLYFYPYPTLGLLLVAGAAYFYFTHWRKPHAH